MNSPSDKELVYDAQCIVCLKVVRDGDALVHIPFENHIVTICCPLCFEALKSDPSYLKRKLPPKQDNPSMF